MLNAVESMTVSFEGALSISNIDSAYDELKSAFTINRSVLLDIDAVTEADLTFIQLIEAARLRAREMGGELALQDPAAGAVLEVLQRGGFLDDDTSDRAKFWLKEATQA